MNVNSIGNSAFGKIIFQHIGTEENKIKAQKSKIENAAKGNNVYINRDIDPIYDVCDGWTVSMPVKDSSSPIAAYSAKILYTNENFNNIVDIVTQATSKLSQIV